MTELINVLLTKNSPEVVIMDTQVKALSMSRNELIIKAITILLNFEPTFYKKLEVYKH
ncbi:hypothetical protein QTL86_22695 [Cellulosilyticum sp. ST5]|uniref:hypothetical protein n=1 Tax=Cellulosilyticum sp. ST5 TaxID=3055805 RepID=UPI0039772F3A